MEQGPLFFQQSIREQLQNHHKKEQAIGKEIWPAQQAAPETTISTKANGGVNYSSGTDYRPAQKAIVV
jgi:hypothetical protein